MVRPGGLATEVVREAARRRNIRLEWIRLQRAGVASLLNRQVDLWPLMTITEERKRRFHISEPYLEHGIHFPGSPGQSLSSGGGSQAAYTQPSQPGDRGRSREKAFSAGAPGRQANRDGRDRGSLPGSRRWGVLRGKCALTALLDGMPCAGVPLRSIWEPSIHTNLGVASTFEAAGIADEIRAEIGNIATEGRLSSMASRWGDFSVRNTETIHLLQAARQRERNLFAAILVFAFLLLLATWQTFRHRREAEAGPARRTDAAGDRAETASHGEQSERDRPRLWHGPEAGFRESRGGTVDRPSRSPSWRHADSARGCMRTTRHESRPAGMDCLRAAPFRTRNSG